LSIGNIVLDNIRSALGFSYEEAFSRNLGWVTAGEQQMLRGKRGAIAGMGGVGGSHLITLTRLGIGAFHIADFDQFEQANFNRQAGARMSSAGKSKVEVLADMARDINPELNLKIFAQGVTDENLDEFLVRSGGRLRSFTFRPNEQLSERTIFMA
jgi:tRNA A37 threonylcarbamoyladenosine dehydratase